MSVIDSASKTKKQLTPARRHDDRDSVKAVSPVSELERTLSNIPVADRSRVAALKSAILKGSYKIDAKAIAESMIQHEKLLGD